MISSQAITRQFANYINSPWRRYNVGSWKAVGHHHTWDTAASAWSIPDTLDDNSSLGTRALDNYSAGKCPSADRQSSTHTAHNRTLCNYFLVHMLVHASICKVALFCITLAIHPSCSAKTLAVTHTHNHLTALFPGQPGETLAVIKQKSKSLSTVSQSFAWSA